MDALPEVYSNSFTSSLESFSDYLVFLVYLFSILVITDILLRVKLATSRRFTNTPPRPPNRLFVKAQQVMADFGRLEQALSSLDTTGNNITHTLSNHPYPVARHDSSMLTNKLSQPQEDIQALQTKLASVKRARNESSFSALTDRLLLWNRIWKQEKEIQVLQATCEQMKRSREAMIKRTAERMMVDVRKEGLVEDFVKDLIEELATSKKDIANLRSEHEREVAEIHDDWLKDYRRLLREADRLKLGQRARSVEQEVADSMEQLLLASLQSSRNEVTRLTQKLHAYESSATLRRSSSDVSLTSTRLGGAEDDASIQLSVSSTCVSTNSAGPFHTNPTDTTNPSLLRRSSPKIIDQSSCSKETAKPSLPRMTYLSSRHILTSRGMKRVKRLSLVTLRLPAWRPHRSHRCSPTPVTPLGAGLRPKKKIGIWRP